MFKKVVLVLILIANFTCGNLSAQSISDTLMLNGIVEFEQTRLECPPEKFTRKIIVPGLINLAKPEINQLKEYYSGRQDPRYSWYRFKFRLNKNQFGKTAILKILKSRFNTQVLINGHDCGTYMQCNTPIDVDLTAFLKNQSENILLIRIGDAAWLPKESALGVDREKFANFPGIWDDIFITFSGPLKITRSLLLPNLSDSSVTVKLKLENFAKLLERNLDYSDISYSLSFFVRENNTGKRVSRVLKRTGLLKCQSYKVIKFNTNLEDIKLWTPGSPFLYEAVITVDAEGLVFHNYGNPEIKKGSKKYSWIGLSDKVINTFGMREFRSAGKFFHLNGKEIRMFGSTLTLNRFFEDRERADLPWDREWVKKLIIDIPKTLGWNTFRVSLGLLPSFWYDLADKYGILIQNEYPMWGLRGSESEIKKEYTDWVWSDGNHPSIVIWDALNEQADPYMGNKLLPELRKLDPTRIWDAGWTDAKDMTKMDMEEIHWYVLGHGWWSPDSYVKEQREKFRFGTLFSSIGGLDKLSKKDVPLLLNEYGWLWLNRDGKSSAIRTYGRFKKSDITPFKSNYEYYEVNGTQLYSHRDVYEYYLGSDSTPKENRDFQAYLLGIETELLRSTRIFAGVISFPYLTNNKGYTGDWFTGKIKELKPSQGLLMQYHTMKPFAVFINLEDGRYLKNPKWYKPDSHFPVNLLVVNDTDSKKQGNVTVKLFNNSGKIVWSKKLSITVQKFWQKIIPIIIKLPKEKGGYMLLTELSDERGNTFNQISRRYLRVGSLVKPKFPAFQYQMLPNWVK